MMLIVHWRVLESCESWMLDNKNFLYSRSIYPIPLHSEPFLRRLHVVCSSCLSNIPSNTDYNFHRFCLRLEQRLAREL